MNSEEVQSQIQAGVAKAQAGRKSLQALKTQLDSYNTFYQGVLSYTAGVDQANEGAQQILAGTYTLKDGTGSLVSGAGQLKNGSSSLKSGTSELKSGTSTLKDGTSSLKSGVKTLKNGTSSLSDGTKSLFEGVGTLKDGSAALVDGVKQLNDGAMTLSKGMKKFKEEGIDSIVDAANGDVRDIIDRFKAVQKASKKYNNYSGISDDMDGKVDFTLKDKVRDGKLYVEQGIIAGCAGGGFENICQAADIIRGRSIGADEFTLSVYPASTPIYMELAKNGVLADLIETGTIVKTAFCGPCFGAGDTPANNALSIRHSTRNFPNREGSKIQNGQISSVALMDARSIAATAANKGYLTAATDLDVEYKGQKYFFDKSIYDRRVYNGVGKADPSVEIKFGPNIKDWPEMIALTDNLLLKVASVINDPVTTTDELIPSGETSSYRSNPLGLAEFTLSRKDPEYVGRAKAIQAVEKKREELGCFCKADESMKPMMKEIKAKFADREITGSNTGYGSTIFAVKPGDGSAREQAASCQKVLGGWANIAKEYATKRYRSNLINWGMLPFIMEEDFAFDNDDYVFIPGIREAVQNKDEIIKAYVVNKDFKELDLKLGSLTDDERQIIMDGCLINYYKNN